MASIAEDTGRAEQFAEHTAANAIADAVKEALAAFNKALRFRRLYPPTHEFYRRALVELTDRFKAAHELQEEVRIDVGAQSFKFGNATVFTDERGPKNLPF